jgi:hypothetical protein
MEYQRLHRWKYFHRGEDCLLICNGPSLNLVEWQRINTTLVRFGLNKIYLGEKKFGFVPRYLCCVNEKVLRQSAPELNRLGAVKFVSNRVGADLYPENPLLFTINTLHLPENADRFSRDICQYVHEGWTVTHAALQIIYYMGFQRVFIVGMDHRFSLAVTGQENTEVTIDGGDPDHFDPSYFGGGQRWDQPDLANSEISYRAARVAFEAAGRQIVDCTTDGACRVFEKLPVSSIYV